MAHEWAHPSKAMKYYSRSCLEMDPHRGKGSVEDLSNMKKSIKSEMKTNRWPETRCTRVWIDGGSLLHPLIRMKGIDDHLLTLLNSFKISIFFSLLVDIRKYTVSIIELP